LNKINSGNKNNSKQKRHNVPVIQINNNKFENNIGNISNINDNINNMNFSFDIGINNMNNINNNIINNMINLQSNNNINQMNNNISNMNIFFNNNKNMNNNMININNNMNNISNMNNNMNNMIQNNNLINNKGMQSPNNLNQNYNNQINNNYMIQYNINFTTNNGIKYVLSVKGKTTMQRLLSLYESTMNMIYSQYFYNEQKIIYSLDFCNNVYIADYFKNEKNPTIFVINGLNQTSKLINVTFKLNNGEKVILFFNSDSTIDEIRKYFLNNIFFGYDFHHEFSIKLLYNGQEIYTNNVSGTIGYFFQNDNNPIIIVNDPYNLIGKKVQITFKTNHGYKEKIICYSGKTIGNLLRLYLYEIDENFSNEVFFFQTKCYVFN